MRHSTVGAAALTLVLLATGTAAASPGPAKAPPAAFYGSVVQAGTSSGIWRAEVSALEEGTSAAPAVAYTNKKGKFRITRLTGEEYFVVVGPGADYIGGWVACDEDDDGIRELVDNPGDACTFAPQNLGTIEVELAPAA